MNSQVIEPDEALQIPEERRCVFVFEDGRRCRMRRWGTELCFHHDPAAAEKRKNRGRPLSRLRMLAATEVHALLTETLRKLQAGQISAGEAYATGYLAQLVLGNLRKVREEFAKTKNEWEHHVEVVTRVRMLDEGRGKVEESKETKDGEKNKEERFHRRGAEVAEQEGEGGEGDAGDSRRHGQDSRRVGR